MKVKNMNEIKVKELANILNSNKSLEFQYKGFYYQIFESSEIGYVVNMYSLNEKDEDDDYLDCNLIDGGLCTGSAKDAVEFLLK
ncbi:hypothetical protein N9W00_00345 [Arcobacteraceae bacterium]|nr:hypothetical protein [Arcobacteraceae bacterium]